MKHRSPSYNERKNNELGKCSNTEFSQLAQLAMINCRLPVSTALAEQEQHYSCPTTAVPL
jgi:hypothetical protein